jgi:predicted ferric reductase
MIIVFLMENVFYITIEIKDIFKLTRRSELMFIIILMPLSLGGNMNLIVNYCGIGLDAYARMHRWLGGVAIVQGLIHTAAAVSLQKPDLRIPSDIGGLTVSYV